MKVKNKVTGKVYDYPERNYTFRSIRFYEPGVFEEFSKRCKKRGMSANLEINNFINFCLENNIFSEQLIKSYGAKPCKSADI